MSDTPKAKHPGGRPSKFETRFIRQAFEIALLGATDEDYARIFDVDVSTISKWKNDYPKFSESIKKGKDAADAQVVKSLFKRANGYSHPDVDIKVIDGEIVITKLTKHYPPDTVAGIYWLNNRQKKNWRSRQEVEAKSEITHKFEELDDEQLDRAIKARQDRISQSAS